MYKVKAVKELQMYTANIATESVPAGEEGWLLYTRAAIKNDGSLTSEFGVMFDSLPGELRFVNSDEVVLADPAPLERKRAHAFLALEIAEFASLLLTMRDEGLTLMLDDKGARSKRPSQE